MLPPVSQDQVPVTSLPWKQASGCADSLTSMTSVLVAACSPNPETPQLLVPVRRHLPHGLPHRL